MPDERSMFFGPGFGTLVPAPADASASAPGAVSLRAVLRDGLPPIYHESDFAMRFVGALERVLDPVVAVLDALPEHFSADYASRPGLDLLAAWLGVELDESLELDARRETVRLAADLGRRRGTVRGLELALRLSFPDIPMRVEDGGGVHWSADRTRASGPGPASFAVYVDVPLPAGRQVAIARCIERHKPADVGYRLRVRSTEEPGRPA